MYKKIIGSIVLITVLGVLIYGAVNRTLAKTSDASLETAAIAANHGQAAADAEGQGWGRDQSARTDAATEQAATGQGYGRQGQGQNRQAELNREDFDEAEQAGQGYSRQGQNKARGQNRQAEQAGARNAEAEHANTEWQTVQGEVVSLTPDTMTVETADGSSVLVAGRIWRYIQETDFVVALGDQVTLNGFEENGAFKIGELANDVNGQIVQIRETSGRPLWAGRGQGRSR